MYIVLYETMYNYNKYFSLYKKLYNDNKYFHYIRKCIYHYTRRCIITNISVIHENAFLLYEMMYIVIIQESVYRLIRDDVQ